MNWIILIVALFLLLLLFPLLLGTYWYFRNEDSVLEVKQVRRRDPRYFAHSFEALFLRAWLLNRDGGDITLSKKEPYLLADEIGQGYEYEEEIKDLLVAENKELYPPPKTRFLREIYSWQNAHISEGCELRAIRTKGNLILGRNVSVSRWADGDGTVAVYDNCDLGMSLTSGTAMTIGKNCAFRRLFAPVIHTGSYPDWPQKPEHERQEWLYCLKDPNNSERIRRWMSKDDENEDGFIPSSFVTTGKGVVEEDVVVQGGIRSHKGIRVAERAVVCGDLFAEGDIYLCSHSTVLGNVFTQGNIYCERDVVIGRKGRVSSLVARGEIVLGENCFIYGYVSNEGGGVVCPENRQDELPEEKRHGEEQYLRWPKPSDTLIFETPQDFLLADVLGYRHNSIIRKVVLPEGVKEIPESMFFDCPNLEEVHLPSTLEKIGNYAFAGCKSLGSLELESLNNLRYIGKNAFDGCLSLKDVAFPSQLEVSEDPDFRKRIGLEKDTMTEGSEWNFSEIYNFQNSPFIEESMVPEAWEEEIPSAAAASGIILSLRELKAKSSRMLQELEEKSKRRRWFAGRRGGSEPSEAVSAEELPLTVAAPDITLWQQELEEKNRRTSRVLEEKNRRTSQELEEKNRRRRRSADRRRLRRLSMTVLGVLFLAALAGVDFAASLIVQKEEQESLDAQEEVLEDVDLYRNQGLSEETELASVPEEITEEYVVFEDRVLARSTFTDEDIATSIEALRIFLESMGTRQPDVEAYAMVVPLRIAFEDAFSTDETFLSIVQEEKEKLTSLENTLLSGVSDLASAVPLMDILDAHKEEYLFYRTSRYWTARGAYYGAQQFLEAAGLETFPIETFWEYGKDTTSGSFANDWDIESDWQYYYLYENYNPLVELLGTDEKKPMISLTRSSTGIFVGSGYDAYKIDGLAENGRAVMVLGRSNAAVCVPWLVTEFETIVYIDMAFFSPDEYDFWQMFSEYGITDVLIVEDDDAVTSSRFPSTLEELAEQ